MAYGTAYGLWYKNVRGIQNNENEVNRIVQDGTMKKLNFSGLNQAQKLPSEILPVLEGLL